MDGNAAGAERWPASGTSVCEYSIDSPVLAELRRCGSVSPAFWGERKRGTDVLGGALSNVDGVGRAEGKREVAVGS